MPRLKPTTKVDMIGNLDLKPENAVLDFKASKAQEKYFVKPPRWDTAGDSVEMLYIRNEREHKAMLRLQNDMLENAQRQTAQNNNRTEDLFKIQANLRKRLIEVNSFLKDCDEKRTLAERVVDEETEKQQLLVKNINEMKNALKDLSKFRYHINATVKEFESYERVIDEVVQKSNIFVSVKDCMDRCDALMLAQGEVSKLEAQTVEDIENIRRSMVKVTKEAALTVLGLKNDLAELERSYTYARNLCFKYESLLSHARKKVNVNDLNKERVKDGILQLFRMLCLRRQILPIISGDDFSHQLDFIKHEVEIMTQVIRKFMLAKLGGDDGDDFNEENGTAFIKC